MTAALLTVRDLRRQWKPHKERLLNHPTAVRFHRACSWLDRSEKLDGEADSDLVLVNQWIALNALYGQWDTARREPKLDRESWRTFFDKMLRLDREATIAQVLVENKPLVISILEDEYLAGFFWREPCPKNKQAARNNRHKGLSLFVEGNWTILLDQLLDRVYLLRCQLIHGAATCGGKLNRTVLRRATQMLRQLLPAVMQVFIEHGVEEDWGLLCYPPLNVGPVISGNGLSKPRPR